MKKLVIVLRGGKPICCPCCKKRDGKHYQIDERKFKCFHCGIDMEIEVLDNE